MGFRLNHHFAIVKCPLDGLARCLTAPSVLYGKDYVAESSHPDFSMDPWAQSRQLNS
jgi:hypothetical protein